MSVLLMFMSLHVSNGEPKLLVRHKTRIEFLFPTFQLATGGTKFNTSILL